MATQVVTARRRRRSQRRVLLVLAYAGCAGFGLIALEGGVRAELPWSAVLFISLLAVWQLSSLVTKLK
jgi:hypothetical protein